jgi:glutaredoxin
MIKIYGDELTCSYCRMAKKLVQDYNLQFTFKNASDIGVYEELLDRLGRPSKFTIPQIWWDERYIGGYTELAQEIENTLGAHYG